MSRRAKAPYLLLKCPCGAQHNAYARWVFGEWAPGTAGEFYVDGDISPGSCPVCRRPPVRIERNPRPAYRGCM